MKMKLLILLTLIIFAPFTVNAYEVKMDWQKNWGGNYNDYFKSVVPTEDGGFIVAGYSSSTDIQGITNKGNSDGIIVRYDKDENMIWQTNWGGNVYDNFESVVQTLDGGFIVVGYTSSTDIEGLTNKGANDAIVVKYDKDGNMLWQTNYGGNDTDRFYSVVSTEDDGFIAVGISASKNIEGITNKGNDDGIIVRYDKDGNMLWQKNWGGNGIGEFQSVILTEDGGFVVLGSSNSHDIEGITNKGNRDAIIVKYDKDGNMLWQKNWGGSAYDYFNSVVPTLDGGFIVVGTSNSDDIEGITNKGNSDAIIVRYDKDGNMIWNNSIGGNGTDEYSSVVETLDGGFIVVGASKSSNIEGTSIMGASDALIIKYDKDGNMIWKKIYAGNSTEYFSALVLAKKGGFIAVGNSASKNIEGITNKGNADGIIVKYSFEYNLDVIVKENGTATVKQNGNLGIITPIPNEGYAVDKVTVKDSLGNEISITTNSDGTYTFELSDDVTVEVSFVRNFKISKVYTKNGDVEVSKIDGGRGLVSFKSHSGFEFDKVVVKNSKDELVEVTKLEDGTYSFELSDDVSVEVVFKREIVNPKTGVTNAAFAVLVGFIISFIGYTLVKKNCYQYDL